MKLDKIENSQAIVLSKANLDSLRGGEETYRYWSHVTCGYDPSLKMNCTKITSLTYNDCGDLLSSCSHIVCE